MTFLSVGIKRGDLILRVIDMIGFTYTYECHIDPIHYYLINNSIIHNRSLDYFANYI